MRLKGHSLTHLATAPGGGLWVWECECGHRSFGYVDTAAIARTQHREHKMRIGTPEEHATMQVSPRIARCICGHHIAGLAGGMPGWPELTERFDAHRREAEEGPTQPCDHGSYWIDENGVNHCLTCPTVTERKI